jgi:hypothetical protein
MLEKFKGTLVVCSAIVSFSGGAYVLGSSFLSVIDSRVTTVTAANQSAEDANSSITPAVKKLMNLLK